MRLGHSIFLYFTLFFIVSAELLAGYWIISLAPVMKILGFGLHVILVVLFAIIVKNIKAKDCGVDRNFALVSFTLTLAIPVYGMVAMTLFYLIMHKVKMQPVKYFEIDESFLPERKQLFEKNVDKSIIGIKRDELEIDAFKDIFRSHDQKLEVNAISKLSKLVNKRSFTLLQEVVKNTSTDTKVLAASALIEMEDKIIKKIEDISSELKETPENVNAILELARAYDLYCYLGVLDEAVNNYYQNLALEQYRKFLICNPTHPEATLEYGRTLLNSGNLEKAIKILQKATELSPDNPNPYIWLAEAYYESQAYPTVTDICMKLYAFEKLPDNLKEIVHWWAGDN